MKFYLWFEVRVEILIPAVGLRKEVMQLEYNVWGEVLEEGSTGAIFL